MVPIRDVCARLEAIAPVRLAEDWDNVGLLVGDPLRPARRVMTCLTVTPESVKEAVDGEVDLIVTHHPFPFRPLQRITTATTVGRLLWRVAGAGISIYSPHTAWDSASSGINQQLAEGLALSDIQPLTPRPLEPDQLGSGRCGLWRESLTLAEAVARVKQFLGVARVQCVGASDDAIARVALGCGSAGSFLPVAQQADCQLLIAGEANFHTCLEAQALGIAMLLVGHYASERFAMETLAADLQAHFPDVQIWASRRETDPLRWV
jgi:dinuclear metal center YbgI/SA1388 family protein